MATIGILGAPEIGRTLSRSALTAVFVVAGVAAALAGVGPSPWLVGSALLLFAAAALPRSPFAALVMIQVAVAATITDGQAYGVRLAVVLLGLHVVQATWVLLAWLPRRVRIQAAVLRRPFVRFAVVQVGVQAAAFVVLGLLGGRWAGSLWLALVAGVAALALAVLVLAPLLRSAARG